MIGFLEKQVGETRSEDIFIDNASFELLMIILVVAVITWFLSGYLLSRWVKKDLIRRKSDSFGYVPAVILTSIAGFVIYLMVRRSERCALQEDETSCELEEIYEGDIETTP